MKANLKKFISSLKLPTSFGQNALFLILIATSYFVRASQYILHPQLFAEDGSVWLAEGHNKSASVIFHGYNGFFHITEKLFGYVVAHLPLLWSPIIFVSTAWLFFMYLAYLLLSSRTKILSNNYERIFVVISLCLIANMTELFFNFSNSIFLLGIIGCLIMISKSPKNRAFAFLEKTLFIFSCITLPFSWFFAVIVLVERFINKKKENFFFYTAIITAVGQVLCYLTSHVNRSPVTLVSLVSKWTVLELYNQIIIPGIRFARLDVLLPEYTGHRYAVFFVLITFITFMLAAYFVLKKSNKQVRYLIFFLFAMTFASIKSPTINVKLPLDAIKDMAVVHGGSRYFVYGIISVEIILAKFTREIIIPKFRYSFLVLFMTLGLLTSIHQKEFFVNKNFMDYTAEYQSEIRKFNSGTKNNVIIDVNPTPWKMEIRK